MYIPKYVFLFHHSMFRFLHLFKSVSLLDYIMVSIIKFKNFRWYIDKSSPNKRVSLG